MQRIRWIAICVFLVSFVPLIMFRTNEVRPVPGPPQGGVGLLTIAYVLVAVLGGGALGFEMLRFAVPTVPRTVPIAFAILCAMVLGFSAFGVLEPAVMMNSLMHPIGFIMAMIFGVLLVTFGGLTLIMISFGQQRHSAGEPRERRGGDS